MTTSSYRRQITEAIGARLEKAGLGLHPVWGTPPLDDAEDCEVINWFSHEHRRALQVYEGEPAEWYFEMFGEGVLPPDQQIDLLVVTVRDARASVAQLTEIYRAWLVDLKPREELDALIQRHEADFA